VFDELTRDSSVDLDEIVNRHVNYKSVLIEFPELNNDLSLAKNVYAKIPAEGCSPELKKQIVESEIVFKKLEDAINSCFDELKSHF
jgi:hypothetical protein